MKEITPNFGECGETEGIGFMLDACLRHVRGHARDFIESLDEFYQERGFLTEAQTDALRKYFNNVPEDKL